LLGVDVVIAAKDKQASGLASRQLIFANVHLGRVASYSAEKHGKSERADEAGSIPYCAEGFSYRVTANVVLSLCGENAMCRSKDR